MDPLARRDPADHRRVVVRVPEIRVAAPEGVERLGKELPRRQEARRPLREAVELLDPVARRPRVAEVVAPGELDEDVREGSVRVPLRVHVDVCVPDLLALSHPALHEHEALRPEAYAPVEQEHPLALRRSDARATRLEASAVLLRDDRERQAIADGGPRPPPRFRPSSRRPRARDPPRSRFARRRSRAPRSSRAGAPPRRARA